MTRFHAGLKPGEMRDITFEPAKKNRLLKGQFLIDLGGRGRGRAPRRPAGLALPGVARAAVRRWKARRARRLRSLGMFLALAALCLL